MSWDPLINLNHQSQSINKHNHLNHNHQSQSSHFDHNHLISITIISFQSQSSHFDHNHLISITIISITITIISITIIHRRFFSRSKRPCPELNHSPADTPYTKGCLTTNHVATASTISHVQNIYIYIVRTVSWFRKEQI